MVKKVIRGWVARDCFKGFCSDIKNHHDFGCTKNEATAGLPMEVIPITITIEAKTKEASHDK